MPIYRIANDRIVQMETTTFGERDVKERNHPITK